MLKTEHERLGYIVLQIDIFRVIMIVTICNILVINMNFTLHRRKKSIIAGLLTFVLVLNMIFALCGTSAVAVSKTELNALKKQQEQLAEERAGIQEQADELGSQVTSQTKKLAIMTAKLSVTNLEIENLSEQIVIYTNSIAEMENELNKNGQKERELLEKYKKRIRVMEENGSVTYISILFGAANFEDFLSRLNCIKEITKYDNGLITEVQDARVRVQNAKTDMESEMADQESIFAVFQEKQADLAAQQVEADAILASLTADSAEYETQLDAVRTLQVSLSGQITDMEIKLAEQERIKAEQVAAARAAAQAAAGNNNSWYGDSTGTASGQEIVDYARSFLGVDYVYGGTSPSGFDCSGLVYYCYRHFGYSVNRTATAQSYNGVVVSSSELQPGDLIFFGSVSGGYITHVGIYVGNGQFLHAPHTGDVVKISSLSTNYYTTHYWGARRIAS